MDKKIIPKKVEVEKKVIKREPKIHIEKYFNLRNIDKAMKAFFKARFGIRMYTEKQWDILIDRAIKKRVT